MLDKNGKQVHYRKGTKVITIQAFDGNLFCCVNDKDIYALEQIPDHEEKSKELDADYQKPKENSPELTGLMFHLFGDIFKNA